MASSPELTPEARNIVKQEVAELFSRERTRFLALLGVVASITGTTFLYSVQATSKKIVHDLIDSAVVKQIDSQTVAVARDVERLQSMVKSIETADAAKLADLVQQLKTVTNSTNTADIQQVLAKLTTMRAELDTLNDQIKKSNELFVALGDNPTKSLALPLLRKDVDALSEKLDTNSRNLAEDLAQLRTAATAETSRIYDLGKWFLGLMLAASVIPLVEPLFKRNKEAKHTPKESGSDDKKESTK